MAKKRRTVFVSYAHEDRRWLEELTSFLAPWIRDGRLALWDDSRIEVGAEWAKEIDDAMNEASVAVLLVTHRFLASDFIVKQELPFVLERVHKRRLRLVWIAVEYSGFEATPLKNYQAANDPKRPLDTLSKPHRNKAMVDIAKLIADAATIGTFAGGLQILDDTTEPFEAKAQKRPEGGRRDYEIQADYEPVADRITFKGTTTVITAADLEKLPDEDREFIADLEDSLRQNYARWNTVRKGRGNAGGALDPEIEKELARIAKLICQDLNNILEFLRKMHKYELEDHYGRYRYICEQLAAT